MPVICLSNNIVLGGRGFCTSSIAQITGNVPRLLADIVEQNRRRFEFNGRDASVRNIAGFLVKEDCINFNENKRM